jgi:replicative DNA helicase
MTEKQEDFSKYGKSFQESLAQLILMNRPFSEQIEEVLDINFFDLKHLKVFVSLIFDYKSKYNSHPTDSVMSSLLRSELEEENEATKKQVRDFYARTLASGNLDEEEYIKQTSLDFCKKQKLKEAIIKSVDLIQKSSYEEVKGLIDEALSLGIDNEVGHDYKKDFELRYQVKARNPISTGWELIDGLCKNGLGRGELGVVIAPTGAGKTHCLVHLGANALKAGKTVVHFTLELSESVVGLRYDSCLSNVPLGDLFSLKDEVYEACMEVQGELIIKEYPTKKASTQTLEQALEKIKKKGKDIDLVLVDYGDLLRPVSAQREKRNELESIYEELRGLAQEFKCPIWTASQTNRSGLNAEVITMESISEAFNKCFVADFICSLSRTIKDKQANTGRMFVAKNRNGPDGLIYPLFMDTSNVKIKVLEPTDETIEDIEKSALKRQETNLKEKYKQFRKAGS